MAENKWLHTKCLVQDNYLLVKTVLRNRVELVASTKKRIAESQGIVLTQ